MRHRLPLAALALAAALTALALPALAEESCNVPAGSIMSRAAMEKSLHDRGYVQVRSLSTHNGCYEAKGIDSKGKRFELELDGATGQIVNAE
jgi:hypothetical protein